MRPLVAGKWDGVVKFHVEKWEHEKRYRGIPFESVENVGEWVGEEVVYEVERGWEQKKWLLPCATL